MISLEQVNRGLPNPAVFTYDRWDGKKPKSQAVIQEELDKTFPQATF